MNRTFCVLAWANLLVTPEGAARVCCSAARFISDGDRPLRIDQDSIEDIWNSQHMLAMRRAMLAGEPVADCEACYIAEASGSDSLRQQQNRRLLADGGSTAEALIAASIAADHRVPSLPISLHLVPTNFCNLACRMCCSSYSSQIEADPALARWAPPVPDLVRPDRPPTLTRRIIGPGAALGVRAIRGETLTLDLPVAGHEKPVALAILFDDDATPGGPLDIVVNGQRLGNFAAAPGLRCDIDIAWMADSEALTVQMSPAGIRSIELVMATAGSADVAAAKPGLRPSVLGLPAYRALLANPGLRHINFTGGEPMLMREVQEALTYLIEDGRAGRISVSVATNLTRFNRRLIELLLQFEGLEVYVSIDAAGPALDYIRVGARWSRIRANLARLVAAVPRGTIILHPTVQAYNILEIVGVCRLADEFEVNIALLDILLTPPYLGYLVVPPAVRGRVLADLVRYAETECRDRNREAVANLISHLRATLGLHQCDLLPAFFQFTREADLRHRQCFEVALPDLARAIEIHQAG